MEKVVSGDLQYGKNTLLSYLILYFNCVDTFMVGLTSKGISEKTVTKLVSVYFLLVVDMNNLAY